MSRLRENLEAMRRSDPAVVATLLGVPRPEDEPVVQVELDSYHMIGEDADAWYASLGLPTPIYGTTGVEHVLRLHGVEVYCCDVTLSTALVVLAATCLESSPDPPPELLALSLRALAEELVVVKRN